MGGNREWTWNIRLTLYGVSVYLLSICHSNLTQEGVAVSSGKRERPLSKDLQTDL